MSKIKKRIIGTVAVFLVLVLVSGIAFWGSTPVKYKSGDFNSYLPASIGYEGVESGKHLPDSGVVTLSENDSLRLLYTIQDKSIQVEDKRNRYTWSTSATKSGSAIAETSEALAKGLNQLCTISYTDFNEINNYDNTSADGVVISETLLTDGIRFSIDYSIQGISFDLVVRLDKTGLISYVPARSITENTLALVSIDLFPMLGAATEKEDGYIVFPDSSGAIYSFDRYTTDYPNPIYAPVYTPLEYDLDILEKTMNNGNNNASLPAFGMVKGQNGFLGYICEGDDNSVITLAPSKYIYDLNRVYSTIYYRKTYSYVTPDGSEVSSIEENKRTGDFAVRYLFSQSDEGADYNDLARGLRSFLIDDGRLGQSSTIKENPSLQLQILMGTMKSNVLGDKFVSLTTFDQAKDIFADLKEEGCDNLSSIFFGWQKQGYGTRPSMLRYASSLGGRDAFRHFTQWAEDRNIESYLNLELVWADSKGAGYSKGRDAVQDVMYTACTNKDGDTFLLNPFRQFMRLSNALSAFKKDGAAGIAYDTVGMLVYDDYNKKANLTRKDAMGVWSALLSETKKSLGTVAVQNGNAYTLARADRVYDVMDTDSKNPVFNQTIPFYQLVVHGSIPYTSGTAGNMASDFNLQKLKWIEYGSDPWFIVTAEDTSLLKDTPVDKLFSSCFEDYKQLIIQTYKEFDQNLQGIASVPILSHKSLTESVRCITYENNVTVYVNYGNSEYHSGNITVPPMDYRVIR